MTDPQPVQFTITSPWFTATVNVNPAPLVALLTRKRP